MLALGAGAVARRRDIGFVEGLHLVEHEERGPDDLEAAGKITCIRPLRPLEVGRIEKDTEKLERLYEEGFSLGERFCQNFK